MCLGECKSTLNTYFNVKMDNRIGETENRIKQCVILVYLNISGCRNY